MSAPDRESPPRAPRDPRGSPSRRRGSVLILGLVVAIVLSLTLAAAISRAHTEGRAARWQLERTQAFALAEGIAESAMRLVVESIARFETPPFSGTASLGGGEHPYSFTAIGASVEVTESDGFRRAIQRYRLSASARVGDGFARIERFVDLSKAPLFQYLIFHAGDLELMAGPRMTLDGRIHAGGDLVLDSGESLVVDTEHLRAAGSIHRADRYGASEVRGAVAIKVAGRSEYRTMKRSDDAARRDWPSFALERWNGTVQDGAHDAPEIVSPGIASIKAFLPDGTKGHFHRSADLVIVNEAAYDRSGAARLLPSRAIIRRTMYDAREGRHITLAEIDLGLLASAGAFPPNGLIYAYRTDASRREPGGIRLKNGAELQRPLTIASEDPVFIQGDFNIVNTKPAAVLADAVNLLSGAWDDTKTSTRLPAASETEYNVAFVTGNVPTSRSGGYSGGLEALPRLHEDWTGVTVRIRGSFVCLFESAIAVRPWRLEGVYSPPLRDWRFDRALTEPDGLPPFTPVGAYFRRVLWDDGVPLPFALR